MKKLLTLLIFTTVSLSMQADKFDELRSKTEETGHLFQKTLAAIEKIDSYMWTERGFFGKTFAEKASEKFGAESIEYRALNTINDLLLEFASMTSFDYTTREEIESFSEKIKELGGTFPYIGIPREIKERVNLITNYTNKNIEKLLQPDINTWRGLVSGFVRTLGTINSFLQGLNNRLKKTVRREIKMDVPFASKVYKPRREKLEKRKIEMETGFGPTVPKVAEPKEKLEKRTIEMEPAFEKETVKKIIEM